MINEIDPHKLDVSFLKDPVPEDRSPVFVFDKAGVLTFRSRIPLYKDVRDILKSDPVFLFITDSVPGFLAEDTDPGDFPESDGFAFKGFKELRYSLELPRHEHFFAMTAFQLFNWRKNNRFCGRCGAGMKGSERERAFVCPSCGNTVYPKIAPAVTVAIIDRETDRIVLTKYAGRDMAFYALVAGFTEIGETLEDTVRREVMEETGLSVTNIRYFGSQPWGIVDDLMVGFVCDLDGDNVIHRDENELKLADWFTRDEVELQPTGVSLTNAMMKAFKEGRI